jgi:hypothetical protein
MTANYFESAFEFHEGRLESQPNHTIVIIAE